MAKRRAATAKRISKAGRAARTAGTAKPPVVKGQTSGSMRQRAQADKPFNPSGQATSPRRTGK